MPAARSASDVATSVRSSPVGWRRFPVGRLSHERRDARAIELSSCAAVRSLRAEMNITAQIPLVLADVSAETKARAERWTEFIKRLARVSEISNARGSFWTSFSRVMARTTTR